MTTGLLILLIVMQGIIFGGFAAFVASKKEYDSFIWFMLGFLFSLPALIAIVGVPSENAQGTSESEAMWICLECGDENAGFRYSCKRCKAKRKP